MTDKLIPLVGIVHAAVMILTACAVSFLLDQRGRQTAALIAMWIVPLIWPLVWLAALAWALLRLARHVQQLRAVSPLQPAVIAPEKPVRVLNPRTVTETPEGRWQIQGEGWDTSSEVFARDTAKALDQADPLPVPPPKPCRCEAPDQEEIITRNGSGQVCLIYLSDCMACGGVPAGELEEVK